MPKATSEAIQRELARNGAVVGDACCVRAVIQQVLQDPRFRVLKAVYGPSKRPSSNPEKQPGMPYSVTVARPRADSVKGVRSEKESANRMVNNDLLTVYCVDSPRREEGHGQWRTLKIPCIREIQVYTGNRMEDGSPEKVYLPVIVIDPKKMVVV